MNTKNTENWDCRYKKVNLSDSQTSESYETYIYPMHHECKPYKIQHTAIREIRYELSKQSFTQKSMQTHS